MSITSTFCSSWLVLKPSKKFRKGILPLIAAKWLIAVRSITCWGELSERKAKPVLLAAYISWWSPKIDKAWVARLLAATCITQGNISPAILYILGIINKSPWLAVKVVVKHPACKEPWTIPAAPASLSISTTLTLWLK